jgi:aryl-alcohol dehydrogenase-like predicted oxidoreductase
LLDFDRKSLARAEEVRKAPQRLNLHDFVASQNMWSLAKADLAVADPTWAFIDESFAQWHIKHGFAAFRYLTQANGYFRQLKQNTLDRLTTDARVRMLFDHQENRERFERLCHIQKKHDLSAGQVVLGYLTSQPFPVFPLVGPKTLADWRTVCMPS